MLVLGALLARMPAMFLFLAADLFAIFVGPVIGLTFGRRRPVVSVVTGVLSFACLGWSVYAARGWELDDIGVCKPLTTDVSAIGRKCDRSKWGDCPEFYSCVQHRELNVAPTWECAITCQQDCECPAGLTCLGSKCLGSR